ncbi:MAG: tripartite tricarboxylate transporter permease, partial [bacterium]
VLFRILEFSPVPLMLGFVLGPLVEENLRRALQISDGDPSIFITRPISLSFLIVTIFLLVIMIFPAVRQKYKKIAD